METVKLLAYFFALTIFLQSLYLPQFANASMSSDGSKAEVPVRKIGFLLLAEGTALINGEDIKIQARSDSSHMIEELLSGKILDKEIISNGDKPLLKGRAYFSQGAKLSVLEPHCTGESVELTDGTKINGHITELNKEGLTIEPLTGSAQHIAMNAVSKIHSPKVFNYTIQPDAKGMIFESTCVPATAVNLHHPNKRKRLVLIVVVGLLIATAISCGVAIPVALHNQHHATPQIPIAIRPTPVTVVTVPQTRLTIPLRGSFVSILNARPRFPQKPVVPTNPTRTVTTTPTTTVVGTVVNTNPLGPPVFRIFPRNLILPRAVLLNGVPAAPAAPQVIQ
jgi:hypothetical protein